MLEAFEDKAALVLLVLGFVALGGYGISAAGAGGAAMILLIYGIYAIISVVAGVAAAFITASILGASFGLFGSAVLRLAGIIVFTSAIAVAIPFGGLLSLIVYIGLLMWLFELDPMEVLVFTIILWLMRFVVGFLLAAMLIAALGTVPG